MEKTAQCIKEKANWGDLKSEHRFDHPKFNKATVQEKLLAASPKLHALIQNIKSLDEEDLKTHKKTFKHFIYSDVKSAYGAKLIASGLAASGFHHAYELKKTNRGMSFVLNDPKPDSFATLTSVAFFEKPIGINFRKDLLRRFNERPGNVHGEKVRIIILDSGFREGIDLFDVKYVHLFEPIITKSDQTQAIGRATRFCGQKGLTFDPVNGWPLHVYRYETTIPQDIQTFLLDHDKNLAPADSFFNLFMKFTNIDPTKVTFANILKDTTIETAVDKELTKNIHAFKTPFLQGGTPSTPSYKKQQHNILKKYSSYQWPPVKVENLCSGGATGPAPTPTIVTLGPTQEFIRHYFTPEYPNPGMLLWHGVGTGKTCTAIATATSSFELQDYTILYVTRYTLKPDVWKNMFEQTCSLILQDYLKSGKTLPSAFAAKLRMLSSGWFEPMSYKQFSNLLEGKNKLSEKLFERNGKKDPLHKTLVIIDEAHKLFAADVEGQEKADMEVITQAFNNSSKLSGKDGAKILLMTATPYTSEPIDLLKLLNLIRPHDDKFPETFEEFSKVYLDETGNFTEKGLTRYQNKLSGYISYLSRENDIRTFAYPVIHEMPIPMSHYEFQDLIMPYSIAKEKLTDANREMDLEVSSINYDMTKYKNTLLSELQKDLEPSIQEHKECLQNLSMNVKEIKEEIKSEYTERKKECKELEKEHANDIKQEYKETIQKLKDDIKQRITHHKDQIKELKQNHANALKQATKEERPVLKENQRLLLLSEQTNLKQLEQELRDTKKKQIEYLKLDQTYDIEQVKRIDAIKRCYDQAELDYKTQLANIKTPSKQECDAIEKYIQTFREARLKEINELVSEMRKDKDSDLDRYRKKVETLKQKFKEISKKLFDIKDSDASQLAALEKCLKVKKPAWHYLLKGDSLVPEDIIEDPDAPKAPVYLISGHGSENVVEFKKRLKMPEDKVLVVFPVCARPNFMDTGCTFMDMFNNPEHAKYLRNPIKYKRHITDYIDRPIRVYLPGDYVPDMHTNLFLNFKKDNKEIIAKSGVYPLHKITKMDLPTPDRNNDLGSPYCLKFTGQINSPQEYTSKVHREIFKDNVFKPAKETKSYKGLEHRSFALSDILKDVGPGIYYYIGCRSAAPPKEELYEAVIKQSEEQQEVSKRAKRILPVIENIKLSNASSSASSLPSSSSSASTKSPSKPKENTKPELKRIKAIQKELNAAMEVPDISKLNQWREELSQMNQTLLVETMYHKLNILKYIFDNQESATTVLKVKALQGVIKFEFVKYIEYNGAKFYFGSKLYGYVPADMNTKDMKCSSSLLVKRIKTLYKKNKLIDLPKEFDPSKKEDMFKRICEMK